MPVQRADEIARMEPKVAYYCRMYAVDQVLVGSPTLSPHMLRSGRQASCTFALQPGSTETYRRKPLDYCNSALSHCLCSTSLRPAEVSSQQVTDSRLEDSAERAGAAQGIGIQGRAPEITEVIRALMAKLEGDKKRVALNLNEDAAYCENFACTIFERADRVDRAGRADKNTAMTFYAASVFIEVRLDMLAAAIRCKEG